MKKIPFIIHVSEIEYDVQNRTYVDGKYRQSKGNVEEGAQLMIDDNDANAHFVRRCVQDALGRILNVASEYAGVEVPEVNNVMMDDGSIELTMIMPDQFPESAASAAVSAMHEYITNSAMSQWYEATDSTKHSAREKVADQKLVAVKAALNRRQQYARCMRSKEVKP